MYNRQLDTFLIVAEKKSFSKAAEALYITPSAVIQQMNHLEENLQVRLFHRTRQGLLLTEAGELLIEEAQKYIKEDARIRSRLRAASARDRMICAGTSTFFKIRILYDLWMSFSKERKDYEFHLASIDDQAPFPEEVELIESIGTDDPRLADWFFLKICEVPLGCAVAKHHPLAAETKLRYEQLRQYPVAIISGMTPEVYGQLNLSLEERQIPAEPPRPYGSTLIWDCSCAQKILIAPMCMNDILYDMNVLPCEWDITLSYGIYYRSKIAESTKEFLRFTEEVCRGENTGGFCDIYRRIGSEPENLPSKGAG